VGEPLRSLNFSAQIDTAADRTVVPQSIIDTLAIPSVGSVLVQGFGGHSQQISLFPIVLKLTPLPAYRLTVAAHPDESFILLGRDFLNHFLIVLDGPSEIVEFS
jgi:hypothetical protein